MISVICPTIGKRHDRHALLYAAFDHQTHGDKELLVLDDAAHDSPFFRKVRDPRVRYWRLDGHASIGAKRNMLADRAKGDVLAHFDDDDYYAPSYLQRMTAALDGADLVKLSAWHAWSEYDSSLWRWDTRRVLASHWRVTGTDLPSRYDVLKTQPTRDLASFLDATTWGFGFSYVYRRSLWQAVPFEDRYHGEDYRFVRAARRAGAALMHTPDEAGVALHVVHAGSSSLIYPQRRVAPDADPFGEAARPWMRGGDFTEANKTSETNDQAEERSVP